MHVLTRPFDPSIAAAAETRFPGTPSVLSLGALAAGFGLFQPAALAQTAPPAASAASAPSPAASAASGPRATMLAPTTVRAKAETDKDSVRATTTTVGRGNQDLRDVPQSTTILTEKLLEDRRTDTVKERCTTPPASPSRRPRAARRTSACAASR
jgi:catecholate siderophore receptor